MSASGAQEAPAAGLGDLLDAGADAMVTLEAGGTRLVAHRAVLAARSPVFSPMFHHNTLDAGNSHIGVLDLDGPMLRQLLTYCYTLQAPQLPSMAPQLLAAADNYGLSGLKDACEQQLAGQLTVENAASTAVLALSHSCPSLKQAAVAFVKARTHQVTLTEDWACAAVNHPCYFLELTHLVTAPPAESSAPGNERSRVDPSTRAHSHHTPTTAAAPTVPRHTPPPEDRTVSPLRSLSVQEKRRRLIRTVEWGAVEELRALLAAGADLSVKDDKFCPLHIAAAMGQEEAVRTLVAGGAEVNARSSEQATPLHVAAVYGHADVVRLLLAASADPNARNHQQVTPLHVAAKFGRAEAVAALLEGGANRGARDDRGMTPLQYNRVFNKEQLVHLLRQH